MEAGRYPTRQRARDKEGCPISGLTHPPDKCCVTLLLLPPPITCFLGILKFDGRSGADRNVLFREERGLSTYQAFSCAIFFVRGMEEDKGNLWWLARIVVSSLI